MQPGKPLESGGNETQPRTHCGAIRGHRLRLNLVKQSVLPIECKTSEEVLMETIEQSSDRSDSYEARRNLRQQIRELAQK